MDPDTLLAQKLSAILPHLNEKQRRLLLAAETHVLGRGGITRVAAHASGVSRATIHAALRTEELTAPATGRVRREGGGRRKTITCDPTLLADLALWSATHGATPCRRCVGPAKAPANWPRPSSEQGHQASAHAGRHSLHAARDSLQANAKTKEGNQHPDRDAQLLASECAGSNPSLGQGWPVISVDTKKKELIGNRVQVRGPRMATGKAARRSRCDVHDFPDPDVGESQSRHGSLRPRSGTEGG